MSAIRSLPKRLRNRWNRLRSEHHLRRYSRYQKPYDIDLSFSQAARHFGSRNALFAYMHHHFCHLCPEALRDHRQYFLQNFRGFGDDAFHAMWFVLLREFQPKRCLEIGIYRGQVISLSALIAEKLGYKPDIHGISPFAPVGDSVSRYLTNVDYRADTLEAFMNFDLAGPTLVQALSTDPAAVSHIRDRAWDLIYIDGNHDYEVVAADYRVCVEKLKPGGLLVMDDASRGTEFRPPPFTFAGHPGPSRVAAEYAMRELTFLGAVGHNNVFLKPQG